MCELSAGLDRFEVQLDNGSTVRLRGANTAAAPGPRVESNAQAKALGTPSKTRSGPVNGEASTLVKPELELKGQREDGTINSSFATPGMVGRSGTAMRHPTLDLSLGPAAASSRNPGVYSPPFEEPTTQVLARILMDCHTSPRISPKVNAANIKREDDSSPCSNLTQPSLSPAAPSPSSTG